MSRRYSAARPLFLGFTTLLLLLGTLGLWSVLTRIEGAVIASGQVQVESERQVVQHPDGGVVAEIRARDGDTVAAGDILLRFDGTFLLSELLVVERQLAEAEARRSRLQAERDGLSAMVPVMERRYTLVEEDEVDGLVQGQARFFDARRLSLKQETSQLREQITQTEQQIAGLDAQAAAAERQRVLILDELEDLQSLFDQGLVQAARVLDLQRREAGLGGEIGRLSAAIAEARTRISSLEIAILKLRDDRRSTAIDQLSNLELTLGELLARQASLTEQVLRLVVRAPVSGVVFDSRIAALQSVAQPAQTLMFLVPGDLPLEVVARIDPADIDQVFPGQLAYLTFTTFSRRTTPEIPGEVIRISADTETDDATGTSYYEAVLRPDAEVLATLEDVQLLPGMPVETFLRTEDRTPISYLAQPLTTYFDRAFREE